MELVVLQDGTVGEVRITRSLDPVFGLDEEAIKAARQWLFQPGTRFGEPVAILSSVEEEIVQEGGPANPQARTAGLAARGESPRSR